MYRIAICDDDTAVCGELETIIGKMAKQKRWGVETDIYNTGEELCRRLKDECYDIIILDIELCSIDGIKVGKFIREDLQDNKTVIIFLSGKEQYAMQLFKIRPYDFWIKPIQETEIREELIKIIELIDKTPEYFEYHTGKMVNRVRINEILYMRSNMRKVIIKTLKGEEEFYGNLTSVAEKVPEYFVRIHKSYIINNNYASKYAYDSVELIDGETLAISKPYRKAVREMLLDQRK